MFKGRGHRPPIAQWRRVDIALIGKFQCRVQEAWGWCTGMTQRDGMGREVGGEFRMGNTCIPVADAC